jgi:hypothetical protein
LTALIAGLGLYVVLVPRPPRQAASLSPAKTEQHLGLSAAFDGSLWRLTWNREEVSALHASRALLLIRDGGGGRAIPLTAADLASGKFFYAPQSGELLFSLSVERAGAPPVEEHLRMGGMAPVEAHTAPTTVIVTVPKSRPAENQPPGRPSPVNGAVPAPTDEKASAPAPTAVLSPVPNAEPTLAAASEAKPVYVQLRVVLDEEGHPVSVAPVAQKEDNQELVDAAIRAASSWMFEPARENGKPVRSVQILNFRLGY